MAQEINKIKEY